VAPDDEEENPLQRWIDAEERWGNPDGGFGNAPPEESESATAPAVDTPDEEGKTIEVDSRTSRYFWSAVVLANVAVGASSLGLMLIGFRTQWTLGGALVLVGVLAGVRTYRTYREFRGGDNESEAGA
jgi:hypothetical protein